MKKMKPETLITMLGKHGIKIFNRDGVMCGQGGGIHNMKKSHPIMKLLDIHLDELERYLGTTA